jgi:formate--tetrahydrofolate ligase
MGTDESDLAIARAAALRPIEDVAAALGIPGAALYRYGPYKAKIALDFAQAAAAKEPRGKLVLVTAISPTPAGEGKTTTTIGLGDALRRAGRNVAICLREPSLGPVFGAKGGATGGGHAQVAPMDEINLHFTGDLHAITAANNLLAALIDNHVFFGNALKLRHISWARALDLNDRSLRHIVTGLGGGNGAPRETRFDITAASEVMAIFCLADSIPDLQARLARIIVGRSRDKQPVTAAQLDAPGAMAALLRDAFAPNLVQTLEGTPALVHGGPFANIAHGCNSVIATKTALGLADIVVTEAGFGADLGAEKFIDIKCRQAGLIPAACVVVATIRALKMHGGVKLAELANENTAAVTAGCANLARHVTNMRDRFGLPVVVAVNAFGSDTAAEFAAVAACCAAIGVQALRCTHWAEGGAGAAELAQTVTTLLDAGSNFKLLYPDALPLADKIRIIAQQIYGAADIAIAPAAAALLAGMDATLPVCIAKTQYSFSGDPAALNAPAGFTLPIREARLAAGAGFAVALAGDIRTMPGLPRTPASAHITLDHAGDITGLS